MRLLVVVVDLVDGIVATETASWMVCIDFGGWCDVAVAVVVDNYQKDCHCQDSYQSHQDSCQNCCIGGGVTRHQIG